MLENKRFGIIVLVVLAISLLIIIIVGSKYQDRNLETSDIIEIEESDKEKSTNASSYLYQNEQVGLTVEELEGWSLKDVHKERNLNVTFTNEHLGAIITVLTSKKSNDEIMNELVAASGDVEIIEQEEDYLSYQSKLTNSVRTNIYIEKASDTTFIYTFMTPSAKYEQAVEQIETFVQGIHLGGEVDEKAV